MSVDRLILGLQIAFGAAIALGLGLLLFDPTEGIKRNLKADMDEVSQTALGSKLSRKSLSVEAQSLAQIPLFVMTTGANAYKPKTYQLLGVSVSPRRKAALMTINGASPQWIVLGQQNDDIRLLDLNAQSARIDTPLGIKTLRLGEVIGAEAPEGTGG